MSAKVVEIVEIAIYGIFDTYPILSKNRRWP